MAAVVIVWARNKNVWRNFGRNNVANHYSSFEKFRTSFGLKKLLVQKGIKMKMST